MAAGHAALFPLALLTPLFLAAVLLVPPYIGIFTACTIAYGTDGPNPVLPHWYDMFFILDTYSQLFTYWRAHHSDLSFTRYTLPITALPVACAAFSLWATRKLAFKLRDLFHTFAG